MTLAATTTRDGLINQGAASDASLDGTIIVGVKTTRIYCLPSCRPPRRPNPDNVIFFDSPEEARAAGLRACKLCHPDAFYASLAAGNAAPDDSSATDRDAYIDSIDDSPGPFAFAVDDDGALVWLQFLDGEYPRAIEDELIRKGYLPATDLERTARARAELLEYCRGARQTFTLPLALSGTEWQVAVWQALLRIPFGETRTYGQIAASLGRPAAARAMGRANATNHIPLVVPCHRVVGANGALTGFEGGLHIKARLLEHEARVLAG